MIFGLSNQQRKIFVKKFYFFTGGPGHAHCVIISSEQCLLLGPLCHSNAHYRAGLRSRGTDYDAPKLGSTAGERTHIPDTDHTIEWEYGAGTGVSTDYGPSTEPFSGN